MHDPSETIVAVASHPGPAARGVVRLSGPDAPAIALAGFVPDVPTPPTSRPFATEGTIRLDGWSTPLPATVVVWPGPRSYTGGPIAEIHAVGSPPILDAFVSAAIRAGARPAHPGEFTFRAFLSGRIDLSQSEAVLGVIEATTPAQLDAALRGLGGGVGSPLRVLRDRLLDHLIEIEANLDFVDEADVLPVDRAGLLDDLDAADRSLIALDARARDRGRAGARHRVALIGPPNAGKSRLFNALVGHDRAIVSPVAGTTRDYLVAPVDCDGLIVDLIDTAGEEPAASDVSASAQSHRSAQESGSDLVVRCLPVPEADDRPDDPRSILVATKADLATAPPPPGRIATSAADGSGLDTLRAAIAGAIRSKAVDADPIVGLSPACRDAIDRAIAAVRSAREVATSRGGDELIAADLRRAVDDLGPIVGAVVTEDILDGIFRRFCIGK